MDTDKHGFNTAKERKERKDVTRISQNHTN
jgi:hypothetical protein